MSVVPPLRAEPIGFAHRGARAHARENTLEAFTLARRLGATGLESDVWLTADGIAVLDHDGVRGRLRRTPIRKVAFADLPGHIPSLADLYATVGADLPLSLDVKDPEALDAVLDAARSVGAEGQLWLCHPDWQRLAAWREHTTVANLVDSTRIDKVSEGPERRAMQLSDAGIGTINLHRSDWSAGLVAMFHRFGIECFSWDNQQSRELRSTLAKGVDAVYSDHVDRMTDALAAAAAPPA